MPNYLYRVKHPGHSQVTNGNIEAPSVAEANQKLHAQGYFVLELREEGTTPGIHVSLKRGKVPLKEKIIFTRQLAVMIKAGLPIVKALDSLKHQTTNKVFQKTITDLTTAVRGGIPLSQAMRKFPKVFPEIYIAVIRAGEETGQLSEVLTNLADQQEKDADLLSKIRGAMIYPLFILAMLVIMGVIIVYFVLPSLKTIFDQSGVTLPIATRALLGFSTALHNYFFYLIGAAIGFFYLLRYWASRPSGRRFFDRMKISLPVFGDLNKKIYMARFTRTLAMLTRASLPIIQAMRIVRKTINNSLYDDAFDRIEKSVESGKSLSFGISKEKLFPPMVAQLSSLGEEAASLESVLLEAANFYDKEVTNISQNLSALIEPLMIVLIGGAVGFVVIAVIGPIYNIASAIK